MELILVRHAEPVRIAPGTHDGPADPGLTDRGHEQAERLAAWLEAEPVDHVVTSPLRRAAQTAAPLAAALGMEPEVLDAVSEYDRGADHYIPVEELRETRDDRWLAMVQGRWEDYGGDDPQAFRDRVLAALEHLAASRPGQRVAVVSHGGVINVFTAAVLGIDRLLWVDVEYTSVTRVAISRAGARSLLTLNETGHLLGVRTPVATGERAQP